MNDDGLVTVAAAAAQLGIDPRQVRRYAEKLRPPDRTVDRTVPLRVRIEAVEALRHARQQAADADRTGVRVSEAEARLLQQLLREKDARIQSLERALAAAEGNVQDLRRLLPPAPEQPAPRRSRWWWKR